MGLSTATGEQVQVKRAEFDAAMQASDGSAESVESIEKRHMELLSLEAQFAKMQALDQANEDRKAASEAAKKAKEELSFVPFNGQQARSTTTTMSSADDWGWELPAANPAKSFALSPQLKQARKTGIYEFSVEVPGTARSLIKAAGDPIMSSQFTPIMTDSTLAVHPYFKPRVADLFRTVPVQGAASVRFFVPTLPAPNASDWVAEGAVKPETQLRWTPKDAPLEVVAHWTAVTLQALDDIPQLRAVIEDDLRVGLQRTIDNDLINGTGTPPEIRGILATTGITTGTAAAGGAVDSVLKAITTLEQAGFMATGVIMNPADWATIRGTTVSGIWPWGSPTESGVTRLWGVPVVTSPNMAAGAAIVADFTQGVIYERWGVTFIVGLKNDDLIRNQQTIVCEARLALAIKNPSAFINQDLAA